MEVTSLLTEALQRCGWSLTELAARGGTSRSTLHAYLNGSVSPTVRTLNRLLAAGGLQVRAALEPLWADLDQQVDALLAGDENLDVEGIETLARRLAAQQIWGVEDPTTGEIGRRSAGVGWALDGATALGLHGLFAATDAVSVVLRFDDAARAWLTTGLMRGTGPGEAVGWWSFSLERAARATREFVVGRHGMLRIRLVDELPYLLEVQLPGRDLHVPVVSVEEVERTHPGLAAVLARLRTRRAEGRP